MDYRQAENIVRLGPRVSRARTGGMMGTIHMPSRVEVRDSSTTTASSSTATGSCGANPCETGVSSSTFTMPIVLGIVIPIVGAAILFIYLQRRHVKKQKEEDANDRHASMDFGLGDVPQLRRPTKAAMGMSEVEILEKDLRRPRQLSMDLGVNSPYLLPPELQNSRESLHSLSRTIHQNEDPYRPVSQYYPNDASSLHSSSKGHGSSIYTGSSIAPSKLYNEVSSAELLANASAMPNSLPPTAFVPPPRQNSLPKKADRIAELPAQPPLPLPASPESVKRKGLPTTPSPRLTPAGLTPGVSQDLRASVGENNNYLGAMISAQEPATPHQVSQPQAADVSGLPVSPRPPHKDSVIQQNNDEYDGFMVTPPSPGREQAIRAQRYSMDVPPEEFAQAGLGAPGFDPKRLSMGFRPLPPQAVTEGDDPEIRANRIRSFYKEYFDDSKAAPEGQYYEDYDDNYMGDAAYFDPETNAFIMPSMPHNEPITRRAMTPPPGAKPRFMGPPRAMHGSMGGMGAGGQAPGPRAYSSASGRMGPPGGKPKKPMPPPMALNTLPTPSKLRDDSFSILNVMDFAPPTSIRERVEGRSQSPFGERRAYSPTVKAFTPTVSAFEELAPMPSPHMFRKSGTFTGLDFAPPKRIRDPDTMSDAGSIRSNRSGISQVQLGAIRNGAYRVSKIPKEAVFTKDDMMTQLKPSWGHAKGV